MIEMICFDEDVRTDACTHTRKRNDPSRLLYGHRHMSWRHTESVRAAGKREETRLRPYSMVLATSSLTQFACLSKLS